MFLTYAAGDFALARPVAARLCSAGTVAFDQALTGEPFVSVRGEILRASFLARLRRCTSVLCLYGAHTLEDDWVRWMLEAAARLGLPLLGAALTHDDDRGAERFLIRLGAELVPSDDAHITARAREVGEAQSLRTVDIESIAETLHLMRHSNR